MSTNTDDKFSRQNDGAELDSTLFAEDTVIIHVNNALNRIHNFASPVFPTITIGTSMHINTNVFFVFAVLFAFSLETIVKATDNAMLGFTIPLFVSGYLLSLVYFVQSVYLEIKSAILTDSLLKNVVWSSCITVVYIVFFIVSTIWLSTSKFGNKPEKRTAITFVVGVDVFFGLYAIIKLFVAIEFMLRQYRYAAMFTQVNANDKILTNRITAKLSSIDIAFAKFENMSRQEYKFAREMRELVLHVLSKYVANSDKNDETIVIGESAKTPPSIHATIKYPVKFAKTTSSFMISEDNYDRVFTVQFDHPIDHSEFSEIFSLELADTVKRGTHALNAVQWVSDYCLYQYVSKKYYGTQSEWCREFESKL